MIKCQEIAKDVASRFRAAIDVEIVHQSLAPAPTPPDSPVVVRLLEKLRQTLGKEGVLTGSGGQTVASVLRSRGIGTVAWANIDHNAHAPNERSSITKTIDGTKVMAAMLFD